MRELVNTGTHFRREDFGHFLSFLSLGIHFARREDDELFKAFGKSKTSTKNMNSFRGFTGTVDDIWK
jgi:hypothetical protein